MVMQSKVEDWKAKEFAGLSLGDMNSVKDLYDMKTLIACPGTSTSSSSLKSSDFICADWTCIWFQLCRIVRSSRRCGKLKVSNSFVQPGWTCYWFQLCWTVRGVLFPYDISHGEGFHGIKASYLLIRMKLLDLSAQLD
nr:hypothetical protein [Tanacetum cinerariifolium]